MKKNPLDALGVGRTLLWITVACGLVACVTVVIQFGLLSHIVARVFLGHVNLHDMAPLLALLLGVTLARAAVSGVGDAVTQWGVRAALARIRLRLFTHLAAVGHVSLGDEASGELVTTMTSGVDHLEPYLSRYVPQRYLAVLVPLLIVAVVASQDLLSAALLLATAPLLPLLMVLVGSYSKQHIAAQWTTLTRLSAQLLDALQGLPALVLHNRAASVAARVELLGEEFRQRTIRVMRFAFLSNLVLEFMITASIALVAVELGVRLLSGGIAFERAFWILLLAPEYFRPLRDLGSYRHAAMEGSAAVARIATLLAMAPATAVEATTLPLPHGPLEVSFRDVTFTYPQAGSPALRAVNLTLAAGTRTALIGASGSGKTTVANLLMRFLSPDSGVILVNGVSLAALDASAWRDAVALVPQRPHLFYGNVADNIRLARRDASDEQVAWAAEQAGAAAFIAGLPHGYATLIGERGARLSGGQAQRLAIARAFLRNTPMVILDEPSTHLDPESERELRLATERLARGRSVLIIAHRLNTVYTADRIVVLDRGRVVESGAHPDLMARGGMYRRFVQAGEGRPA